MGKTSLSSESSPPDDSAHCHHQQFELRVLLVSFWHIPLESPRGAPPALGLALPFCTEEVDWQPDARFLQFS